jgi:rhamnogalacturonan endolyase
MKTKNLWMAAAILNCGLTFTACVDNTTIPVIPDGEDDITTKVSQELATPESQMEKLGRGVVALPQTKGIFISWRLLGTDDARTTFDVIRNGEVIAENLTVSNYSDEAGTTDSKYQVVCKVNGKTIETSNEVTPWAKNYMTLALDRPATGTLGGEYSPNDCSVGDVDGDGEYEIFVKWDPSNSKDNSQSDKTDNVFIDCYKLNGTKLWRIDLGVNIRAGAHYTQFMVYDFDGDGKAEMICKTAPGSMDGIGKYVNQAASDDNIKTADNSKDWRTSAGRINGGQEYLTVFNGQTGEAIHTIAYYPNRNALAELSEASGTFNWDDRSGKKDRGDYGNRGERYLAAVAYLSGPDANPSGIFCRGYYTYAYVWAIDFDGNQLKHRWLHRSDSKTQYSVVDADMNESAKITAPAATRGEGSNTMYGNGNHNLSIADVDGDGRDEIIWGSAALDDNGKLLYATGFGHGDAIHLGAMDPDRKGMQVFEVHEEKGTYSWDLHDAATGEIIFKGGNAGKDNGRGMAADVIPESRGYEFWSSDERQQRSVQTGEIVGQKNTSVNFRMYWNGTCYDQMLDGNTLDNWNGSSWSRQMTFYNYGNSSTCNGTKKTPNLQADLFGDWREELILWDSSNSSTLNIFSTNIPTEYRVPTLMHDHTYRMAVAWQNTAYNQPPHLGFYLPDFVNK